MRAWDHNIGQIDPRENVRRELDRIDHLAPAAHSKAVPDAPASGAWKSLLIGLFGGAAIAWTIASIGNPDYGRAAVAAAIATGMLFIFLQDGGDANTGKKG